MRTSPGPFSVYTKDAEFYDVPSGGELSDFSRSLLAW